MKAQRRLIISYFLYSLHDKMKWDQYEKGISTCWLSIYDKEALCDIIKWLFMGEVPCEIDLEHSSKEKLLFIIGFDYHILGYLLDQMEEELQSLDEPTSKSVSQILDQLSLGAHYLRDKPIAQWSTYDYSNYRSLCVKAGFELPLYGIYHKNVTNASKYFLSSSHRLYYIKATAKRAMKKLEKKKEYKNELQILKL